MKLSIIIVNYNVKYFLEQCLCSVKRAIAGIETEVIVVDNHSSDGSIEYLQPKFSWVKFLINKENLGFGKANNKGLKRASGEYILFLNPDTIIPENILQNTITFIQSKKDAGALGIRMLDGMGNFLPESKRSLPTPFSSFYKLTGLAGLFPKSAIFNKYALGNKAEKENYEVDVLCGAFFLCKRNLLLQLNGFDEDFFMYAEDIDLSYRIQKAGYKNYYFGEGAIIHFKGESISKSSGKYVRMFYEAMLLFVKKHYNNKSKWPLNFALQTAIVSRAFISFIASPFKKINKQKVITQIILTGAEEEMVKATYYFNIVNSSVPVTAVSHQNLSSFIGPSSEIIFCMGMLTYQTTVEFLQHLNLQSVKWYGQDSGCMAGSSHKSRQGEVYILPASASTNREQ